MAAMILLGPAGGDLVGVAVPAAIAIRRAGVGGAGCAASRRAVCSPSASSWGMWRASPSRLPAVRVRQMAA